MVAAGTGKPSRPGGLRTSCCWAGLREQAHGARVRCRRLRFLTRCGTYGCFERLELMVGRVRWDIAGVDACWCAAPIGGGPAIGHRADVPVTPASVMKVQVAVAVGSAIDAGHLDGAARVSLGPHIRTPGPAGMSLMTDTVVMSVRDLLVPMITISDNVAADALINAVGLDTVNTTIGQLGLPGTRLANDLRTMLNEMATEAGFSDYAALAAHDPATHGPPTENQVRARLAASAALDPTRGSRTTAADMVRLLSLIWTDAAGSQSSCARLRSLMRQQLTRNRIASGFEPPFTVAAKSGGLLGIVRNEVGVVTDPAGRSFGDAIFTR